MRRTLTALLLLFLVAGSAQALQTRELVALAAMPLAVAAVSDVAGVPASDLVSVVTAMNRAAVPAPQFVEIVRYTPVALVGDTMNPPFVRYASDQYDRGLYGDAYALSLADRLELYGVDEINVVRPVAVTPAYVVQREYVPSYVTTGLNRQFDPLALVAMPLAVAAVSRMAGIPTSDLFSLIASLNQAYVPAPQFVEIVRYAPVAFYENDPQYVTWVRREVDRGIVRTALVRSIESRYQDDYGFRDVDFIDPVPARLVVDREEYIPPTVVTRYERSHPFGGPPGQLKKQLGYQTGAEVVHGSRPGGAARSVVVERDRDRRERAAARERTGSRPSPRSVTRQRQDAERRPARVEKSHGRSGEKQLRGKKKHAPRERMQVRQERPSPAPARVMRSAGGETRSALRQERAQRGGGRVKAERGNRGGGEHGSKGKGRKKG